MAAIRKSSLVTAVDQAQPPAPRIARAKHRRGQKPVVGLTLRVSKEAWQELHAQAMTAGVSINDLIIEALDEKRVAGGLAPLTPITQS